MESSDKESGMSESMEEESRSEVDDYAEISIDSNGAYSVDSGDIINISNVEEDMVDVLHAEDSDDNDYDKESSDNQIEG